MKKLYSTFLRRDVTEHYYLALMVSRRKTIYGTWTPRFMDNEAQKQAFLVEINPAKDLLTRYSFFQISTALNQNPHIKSLWNKELEPKCKAVVDKNFQFVPTPEREVKDAAGRLRFGKKNPLRSL